ncbi:MAG: fused MFS/spermidine synthase [Planctomycetes bacterium]|nr:fused MFS/spermidine synthase [Planctomycetota bacterium]
MKALIGLVLFAAAAAIGWAFQDDPYRFHAVDLAGDQAAVAHRDSAYSNITWVASEGGNYAQLRFFNRVEGGVCLSPTWGDLQDMAKQDDRLRHLVSAGMVAPKLPDDTWPFALSPDPGTLANTRYVNLFPAAVLLNRRLMDRAEQAAGGPAAAYRAADPNILIVGLGSGIGIAVYAHHFPQAAITVVDIDQVVIDMVRDHYPLLRWLETQKTSDGRPRLRLVTQDARQYIRFAAKREAAERPFDVVVLDAYTSGSTIPPHLMTVEFFAQCGDILGTDGILLANIIGAYARPAGGGNKHRVLGGALRSMRAAGLVHAHNMPVMSLPAAPPAGMDTDETRRALAFNPADTRNNITLASRAPLGPRDNAPGWDRLRAFVPYPELPKDRFVSRMLGLFDSRGYSISRTLPFARIAEKHPTLRSRLKVQNSLMSYRRSSLSADTQVISEITLAVREAYQGKPGMDLSGWEKQADRVQLAEDDWVQFARDIWTFTVERARDVANHGGAQLVGALEAERGAQSGSIIDDAPLFTDSRPNADIFNNGR